MSEESDFDDDIDKLLDEIDSVGTQKKPVSSVANESKPGGGFSSLLTKSAPPKDDDDDDNANGAKLTLKSDGEIKVNYQSSGFKLSDFNKPPVSPVKEPSKSVRFPENPLSGTQGSLAQSSQQSQPTSNQSQPPRSSFLSNLLGKQQQQDTPGSSGPSSLKGQGKLGSGSGAGSGSAGNKDDWLGLGAGGSVNPESLSPPAPGSPTMASRRFTPGAGRGFGTGNDSSINFDDDTAEDEELLKAMGLDVSIKSKSPAAAAAKQSQQQRSAANPSTQLKPKTGGFDLDDDFWPKKPAPVAAAQPKASTAASRGQRDTESDPSQSQSQPSTGTAKLRSSLLQKGRDFHIEDSPFETGPKFQPPVTSTPAPKSIVDVLPFLKNKQQNEVMAEQQQPDSFETATDRPPLVPSSMRSISPAQRPPSVPAPAPAPVQAGKTRGKKSMAAAAAAARSMASTPPVPQQQQQQLPQTMYIDPGRSTLQLPSHLVDEDELKSMCNSLKSLYSTQLEMQEKSYQEQMDCLMQSHSRKEDLLKEEIKVIHKEYDARLGRLKNELLETETKLPQRLQSELAAIKSISDYQIQRAPFNASMNFQNQLTPNAQELSSNFANSPRSVHQQQQQSLPLPLQNQNQNQSTNISEIAPANTSNTNSNTNANLNLSIVQDLSKVLDDKMGSILESVHHSTVSALKTEMSRKQELSSRETKELTHKLDSIQKRFDTFAKYKLEEESKKNILIIESEKKLQGEIAKLTKQQRKIKESVVKAAVASVSQTLQHNLEESSHKKDKIASQLKEFRKDVRRVLFDLESKNEVVQKSHVHIESDQKLIIETLRELQTLIQVNSARNLALSYNQGNVAIPSNVSNIQSVQNQQQIQQSEMEIKLLREERNSLSDSISHMNVERRKLNEEKIGFERDKMDFEREKHRLRDLEVQLKIKTAEAEDMKKQAEQVRRTESAKTIESTMKLAEIEKERATFKEHYHTLEQRLSIREQKLIQEKTELMREKEFLEKLRDQLLCPGCMKSVHQQVLTSRSDGDGLDVSAYSNTENASFSSKLHNQSHHSQNPVDSMYFQKESLYLDDLFYKHFNTK